MSNSFTLNFTAGPEHIDMNGHVNNMVWLQWVQDIATAHWEAIAPADHQAAYVWFVLRHEIDYRGNIVEGDAVTARTFIPDRRKARVSCAAWTSPVRRARCWCRFVRPGR